MTELVTENDVTLEEVIAAALTPRVLDRWTEHLNSTPGVREREEAHRMVQIMGAVLKNSPGLLRDLGWQSLEVRVEMDDALRRMHGPGALRIWTEPVR